MLYSHISSFMANRAERMLSCELEALAEDYAFPLPVFLKHQPLVVASPEQICAMLCLQRLSMVRRNVVAVHPIVQQVDRSQNGRFRVWVDWLELAPPGEGTGLASAIYDCAQHQADFKIEKVQYTRLSVPELQPQFAAVAHSA